MHGLDACDICGRQVPTGFTRGQLWRLGWEWAPIIRAAVLPMGLAPVSSRTRWTCGACWLWELMAVEILDGLKLSPAARAKKAPFVLERIRAWRAANYSLIDTCEIAAVMYGYRPSKELTQRIADDMVRHANNVNAKGQITRGWLVASYTVQ